MNPDKVDKPLNPLLFGAIDNCVDEGLSTLSEFFVGDEQEIQPPDNTKSLYAQSTLAPPKFGDLHTGTAG